MRKYFKWNKERLDMLRKLYLEENKTANEIAKYFKTSPSCVRTALHNYNIRKLKYKKKVWTEREIRKLEKMYKNPDISVTQISNYFGVTEGAIRAQAFKNCITRVRYSDIGLKKCSICGNVLPLGNFYYTKATKIKVGYASYCKDCRQQMYKQNKEHNHQRYIKNREKYKQRYIDAKKRYLKEIIKNGGKNNE